MELKLFFPKPSPTTGQVMAATAALMSIVRGQLVSASEVHQYLGEIEIVVESRGYLVPVQIMSGCTEGKIGPQFMVVSQISKPLDVVYPPGCLLVNDDQGNTAWISCGDIIVVSTTVGVDVSVVTVR